MYFDEKKFGSRIKHLRLRKGITQEQMANDLSITLSYLAKLESGSRTPSIDTFIQLSSYFDVSIDYLVLDKNPAEMPIEEMALSLAEALENFAARKMSM